MHKRTIKGSSWLLKWLELKDYIPNLVEEREEGRKVFLWAEQMVFFFYISFFIYSRNNVNMGENVSIKNVE